jgi:hypothetical protein
MIAYDKLSGNPGAFRSLTGLDRGLFERLYAQVQQALEEQRHTEKTRPTQQPRPRNRGAGRKYAMGSISESSPGSHHDLTVTGHKAFWSVWTHGKA